MGGHADTDPLWCGRVRTKIDTGTVTLISALGEPGEYRPE